MKQINHGSVCIHFMDFLIRYASEKGVDTRAVMSRAGLCPQVFKDPDYRVPAAVFMQAWTDIAAACDDKNFGLHLGSNLAHFPFSHIVFSVMLNNETLISALKSLIRYHNLMSDILRPHLTVEKEELVFSIGQPAMDVHEKRQYFEFIFAMVLSFLRYLGPQKTDPKILRFSHKPPCDSSEQVQCFKSRVIYGAKKNEMVFDKALLETKIRLSNPDLLPLLELSAESKLNRLNESESWFQKVQKVINNIVNFGPATIDSVANTLSVSKRTLQNRLKKEGQTFRGIYENSRKERAIALLENPDISIVDIAFTLGFSEQSAFHHAFKKWTGHPPSFYRLSQAFS